MTVVSETQFKIIAHIYNDFTAKFGIPRQSGLISGMDSRIVFEPEYRDINAFRGLEGYSHIWILWELSEAKQDEWRPMVHPPRLGGNKRMGVFATRSPVRPNPIGLSSVRLTDIEINPKLGPVLHVEGADLLNGTPIYDIKPYLSYTDCHTDALCGFADDVKKYRLKVIFPDEWLEKLPSEHHEIVRELLEQDPRPSYQNDETRRYGMEYAGFDIRFKVSGDVLTVCEVVKLR